MKKSMAMKAVQLTALLGLGIANANLRADPNCQKTCGEGWSAVNYSLREGCSGTDCYVTECTGTRPGCGYTNSPYNDGCGGYTFCFSPGGPGS